MTTLSMVWVCSRLAFAWLGLRRYSSSQPHNKNAQPPGPEGSQTRGSCVCCIISVFSCGRCFPLTFLFAYYRQVARLFFVSPTKTACLLVSAFSKGTNATRGENKRDAAKMSTQAARTNNRSEEQGDTTEKATNANAEKNRQKERNISIYQRRRQAGTVVQQCVIGK